MKNSYFFITIFITGLLLFGNMVSGQTTSTSVELKFDEAVGMELDLVDSISGEVLTKLNPKLLYFTKDNKDYIGLEFNVAKKDDIWVFVFDEKGTFYTNSELRKKYKDVTDKELNRSETIGTKFNNEVVKFYNVEFYNDLLRLKDVFQSGAAIFQINPTLNIHFIIDEQKRQNNFNLELLLYHGEKKRKEFEVIGIFKKLNIKITLPDFELLCLKRVQKHNFDITKYPVYADFNTHFINNETKWTEQDVNKFINDIDAAKKKIQEAEELWSQVRKDKLFNKCRGLQDIATNIKIYLDENSIIKFDDLSGKVKERFARHQCNSEYSKYAQRISAQKPKDNIKTLENEYKSYGKSGDIQKIKNLSRRMEAYLGTLKKLEDVRIDMSRSSIADCKEEFQQLIAQIESYEKGNLETYIQSIASQIAISQSCEEFITAQKEKLRSIVEDVSREDFGDKINSISGKCTDLENKISSSSQLADEDAGFIKDEFDGYNNQVGELDNSIRNYIARFESIKRSFETKRECSGGKIQSDVNDEINALRLFLEQISNIRQQISEALNSIDANIEFLSDQINIDIHPHINDILYKFSGLLNDLKELEKEFKAIRQSGKFYKWKKNGLLEKLTSKKEAGEVLTGKYDEIIASANQKSQEQLALSELLLDEENRDMSNQIAEAKIAIDYRYNELAADIDRYPTDAFPYFTVVLIALGIGILLFGARVYILAMKNKKKLATVGLQSSTKPLRKENVINGRTDGEDESVARKTVGGVTITKAVHKGNGKTEFKAGEGLKHIIGKVGVDYYEIDLETMWNDTTVKKVYLHRECIKKTYRFYYESCITEGRVLETGGYLIGGWEYDKASNKYNVSLEDFIEPGDDAIYGEYQLNFGAKIGVRLEKTIQNIREKSNKNFTLTAWFHSHPEIKIFLSNHDLDVQERLSTKEDKYKLLALVIDPVTQQNGKIAFETGIFSYKQNGTMNNNDGNMTLIKWTDLYDWAKKPVEFDLKNHYEISLDEIFDKTQVKKLFWSNKSITRFSLFLDDLPSNPGAIGFFKGLVLNENTQDNKQVVFEDFIANNDQHAITSEDVVGMFFCTDNIDNTIASHLISGEHHVFDKEVLVFCEKKDKDLIMITKKDQQSFNLKVDANKRVLFSEIEAWPTRRR